jgi:RNA 3'-terminal phosphate cyclase (ATP)
MDEQRCIKIDGSYGEGGGQILRTALAFSSIFGVPIIIHRIRAGRKNPGLQAQHLKGVEALARITAAQIEGASLGSERVTFIPQKICPGEFRFEVGTAGSVTLLLQALLPPLCLAKGSSHLTLVGGTHVEWSPPFHYLTEILFPTLRSMGISVRADIERWGWYPKGGGVIRVDIEPGSQMKPISLLDRGPIRRIWGISAISNLPRHVAERQKDEALKRIEREMKIDAEITVLDDAPSIGQGSFLFLSVESEGTIAGFSSLGKRGKPAEKVAEEAVMSLKDYMASEKCIDPHLADQLIPFLTLAKGNSGFTTTQITGHLLTNLWVVGLFSKVKISKSGDKGGGGKVEFFNE